MLLLRIVVWTSLALVNACASQYGKPDYQKDYQAPLLNLPQGLTAPPVPPAPPLLDKVPIAVGDFQPSDELPYPPLMKELGREKNQVTTKNVPNNKIRFIAATAKDKDYDRLIITEAIDNAWQSTNMALERAGFIVEKRERLRAWFLIQYFDSSLEKNAELSAEPNRNFFIHLHTTSANVTEVKVYNHEANSNNFNASTPLRGAYSERILRLLLENY